MAARERSVSALERKLDMHGRTRVDGALHGERAAKGLDAIFQSCEAGASRRARAAHAVVANVEAKDPTGRLCLRPHVELHGDPGPSGERLQRRRETALDEDRGMDPACDLPQLLLNARKSLSHPGHLALELGEL